MPGSVVRGIADGGVGGADVGFGQHGPPVAEALEGVPPVGAAAPRASGPYCTNDLDG